MRPEHEHYDTIEQWIRESIRNGRDFLFSPSFFRRELTKQWERFGIPYESLLSFVRNQHLIHVKKAAPVVRANLPSYLDEYRRGASIVQLARKANYPPYLFARYIVEVVSTLSGKKALAKAMRDPEGCLCHLDIIKPEFRSEEEEATKAPGSTTRLAKEVKRAIESDPMYGPVHDMERHVVGVEYEVFLEHSLRSMSIPFESETELRDRGTSRTPDILLSTPLGVEVPKKTGDGVEWKVISWIDSKALFGDVHTHHTSVLPQAESYVHRFGPGLILYFFGHAPLSLLGDAQGDVVIAGWDVPRRLMYPTGELVESRKL